MHRSLSVDVVKNVRSGKIMSGKLYLCATPIGNLEDITLRVLRTLKEVDLIAAEDTRNSIRLLNHFEIRTPLTSYHEYNKFEKGRQLIEKLSNGENIALITDAGTPAISDPGQELVRMCMDAGIEVTSLPGACACVTALTVSGKSTRRFCFEAFLPTDKKERIRILEELKQETRTIVLYAAPHHLTDTLEELAEVLSDRSATLVRELTKVHESILESTLSELIQKYRNEKPMGECVLVISGRDPRDKEEESRREWDSLSLEEHVSMYEAMGKTRKDAMRQAASDRGMTKRDVYQALMKK